MARLIDGKQISNQIKDELKEEVGRMKEQGTKICLAVIQVGADPASSVYVNNKKKACAYIGIDSRAYELPEDTSEEELAALVEELNEDRAVNGILVQLPLPSHINEDRINPDNISGQRCGWLSSGQCRKTLAGGKGLCVLYTGRDYSAPETFGCQNRRKRMCDCGTEQHCRETYGSPSSAGKRHCNCRSFPDRKSERNYKESGYPGCRNRKEGIYYRRICKRRSGCY